MPPQEFKTLAIALGLGLLVGLQREWANRDPEAAGIRTFPLLTLFGALSGLLADRFGGWLLGAGPLCIGGLFLAAHLSRRESGNGSLGFSTQVAGLVMFAVGALLAAGSTAPAVVTGGTVAVLLHWKRPLHELTGRLGEEDLRAIFRLVLLGMVILPVLPDESFGPYHVLNPFQIWLGVVLIVGISLAGYVAYQLLAFRHVIALAGILGGLISSTATAVSYARRTRESPEEANGAAAVILLASTVVFVRVLGEVAIISSKSLTTIGPPLAAMMLFLVGLSGLAFATVRAPLAGTTRSRPPSNLGPAIGFGLLYAIVLLAAAAARSRFGDTGVYAVAALSGLTDMDAITLSTARLIEAGQLDPGTGWRVILVGAMANLVFTGALVGVLGHRRLFGRVAAGFAVALAGGAVLLYAWPW